MKRLLILAISVVMVSASLSAQNNHERAKEKYHIELSVEDANSDTMLMGYYYAKGTYALDTAVSNNGHFVFEGEKIIYPGLYFFADNHGKYVEFVVYNEELNFVFKTNGEDWLHNMSVQGSKENEAFYEFHRLSKKFQDKSSVPAVEGTEEYEKYMREQAEEWDKLRDKFVKEHSQRFVSKMMMATKPPEVPETDPMGVQLSNQQRWEIFAAHYFDNMPLEEDFLVRTPRSIFYDKVMTFCDKVMAGTPPDILMPYLDKLLDRAKSSDENFHYLLHTLTEKYLQSNIMVYDAVYVHLVKRYYAVGDAFWMTPTDTETEVDRAEHWEKLLVGKVAPDLTFFDDANRPHSLHGMRHEWTLLVFWSPTCGHCKTTIPALYKKFEEFKSKGVDIEAMAVLTEFDEDTQPKWREFIKENGLKWENYSGGVCSVDWHDVYDVRSTPQIYLLDKDKVIKAKKLNEETFADVLGYLLEHPGE